MNVGTVVGWSKGTPKPTTLSIKPEGGENVVRNVLDVHRFAWRKDSPIDVVPGESRPTWIDRP